ncbi:alpha/beta fold hydrolase [Arthrobacter sp. H14]|uniref:alpha/beta fold hydrolase n=1 Tax=Arthrobacter sp. H14 TaxID=1312959 RepID=UPI00047E9AE8|nr:alpha/beta fold hydrolase [Arthrobacter sp. H14]
MVSAAWPGVELGWSRRVSVPSRAAVDPPGTVHNWHLLDNGQELEERGLTPEGTLLCVHGNPTWSYLWRSLVQAATETARPWRVVAVDQLDMGYSDRTDRFRRLEDRITDLGDLTDALQLAGPVITVGHDWGGVISLGWATRHRNQLAGVVLTNTAIHQPAHTPIPAPLKLALNPAVHAWGTKSSSAFLRVTHSLAHPPLPKDVEAAYMAPYKRARRREGIGNFVADIPAGPAHPSYPTLEAVAEGVRTLDVPALLLWGPKDPVFSDRYLRDLMDRLPRADVHRFEGAGHLVVEDRDVAGTVLRWLGQRNRNDDGDTAAPVGAPTPATEPLTDFTPLWAELDRRSAETSTAVVDMVHGDTRKLSWTELAGRVRNLAAGLAAAGVKPGDRVNLLVPPGSDLTALIYACLRLGAVIVVADAGLGAKGLSRAIKGAGPEFIVGIERGLTAARLFGWPGDRISVADLPPARRRLLGVSHTLSEITARGAASLRAGAAEPRVPAADDEAAILFTSGSTGPAKGVVYTHRQLSAMRDAVAGTYGLTAGAALVAGFAPFALLGPALGATAVTPDMDVTAPKTLTAKALAEAAAAVEATAVFASPSALRNVLDTAVELEAGNRNALANVNLLLSAGAPIGEALLDELTGLLPHASLHTPYGMTEALPITDIDLEGIRGARLDAGIAPAANGSVAGAGNGVCVGTAVEGAKICVSPLDGTGAATGDLTTEAGITGEILVRAPHVKSHYDRLWATEQISSQNPGWHRTGDVGHLDSNGRLWVEGRLGHIITTPQGVVTPVALEQSIEIADGVGRAAVVGVGPAGAQVLVAVVETVPKASEPAVANAALAAAVRHAVALEGAAASPGLAAVVVVPELPTDIRHNAKIDRARLAEWASKVLAGGRMTSP